MDDHKVSFDPIPEINYFESEDSNDYEHNNQRVNDQRHHHNHDKNNNGTMPKSILKNINGSKFAEGGITGLITKNKRQLIIAGLSGVFTCIFISYTSGDKILDNKKKYLMIFIAVVLSSIITRLIVTKIYKI